MQGSYKQVPFGSVRRKTARGGTRFLPSAWRCLLPWVASVVGHLGLLWGAWVASGSSEPTSSEDATCLGQPPRSAAQLRAQVEGGRLDLGEAWLELERNPRARSVEAARARYRLLLEDAQLRLAQGQPLAEALASTLAEHRLDVHKRHNDTMTKLLVYRGGNCEARTRLVTALAHDLGRGSDATILVYANHVLPVVRDEGGEHRFGMDRGCPGEGQSASALALLDTERLPDSNVFCRDDRPFFGTATQATPQAGNDILAEHRLCAFARWPLEQHGDPVAVVAGPTVVRLAPSVADLTAYSTGLVCWEGVLAAASLRERPAARLARLAAGIGYADEAALEFAAAGELDVTREIERLRAAWFRESMRLIDTTDWTRADPVLAAWSLITLGPRGHDVMLQLTADRCDFVASNTFAMLLRDAGARHRALLALPSRPLPQQIEIADRAYWEDEKFEVAMRREPQGARLLALREAVRSIRRHWPGQTCRFGELTALTGAEVARRQLETTWQAPLVVMLLDDAMMPRHRGANPCRSAELLRVVPGWLRQQPDAVQEWLLKRRPEFGASGSPSH